MWALGRYDLRLSEREFWRMRLREMFALIQRVSENRKFLSSRIAVLVCAMATGPNGRALRPRDVFPELDED